MNAPFISGKNVVDMFLKSRFFYYNPNILYHTIGYFSMCEVSKKLVMTGFSGD